MYSRRILSKLSRYFTNLLVSQTFDEAADGLTGGVVDFELKLISKMPPQEPNMDLIVRLGKGIVKVLIRTILKI